MSDGECRVEPNEEGDDGPSQLRAAGLAPHDAEERPEGEDDEAEVSRDCGEDEGPPG